MTLDNFQICANILGFNHNAQLESDGKSSVHFALDVTVDGVNIALCDANFDSASASGVDYFQHNTKFGGNSGGWTESNIRTKILADIFNALRRIGKTLFRLAQSTQATPKLRRIIYFCCQNLRFSVAKIIQTTPNKISICSTIISRTATKKFTANTRKFRRLVIGGCARRKQAILLVFAVWMLTAQKLF